MQRVWFIVFCTSVLALCWFGMMAVHELGHVIGAACTGGTVTRVVLHPLTISRTEVSPNPHPGIVVWSGPFLGCALPLLTASLVSRRLVFARNVALLFAGFCLIANGAYIGIGSFDQVGDCGEMLRTGSPIWILWVFGAAATVLGLCVWHRLGSLRSFFKRDAEVSPSLAIATCGALVLLLIAECLLSTQ